MHTLIRLLLGAVLVGSALFAQIYLSNTLSATVIKDQVWKMVYLQSFPIQWQFAPIGLRKIKARQTLEAWASKGGKK